MKNDNSGSGRGYESRERARPCGLGASSVTPITPILQVVSLEEPHSVVELNVVELFVAETSYQIEPMDEMSLKRPDKPNDSWEPCPPGMLTQLAQHAGRRHALHRSMTIAGATVGGTACVFLLLGSMGWLGLSSTSPSGASPLELNRGVSSGRLSYSCRDAIDLRDRYLLGSASPEAQTAVREHLAHCPHCQAAYRKRAQELKVDYTVLALPHSPIATFPSLAIVASR